ncbi:hypothetical protein E2C01_098374 [Portunus trituberculatus]|uniref:Uncharacterized protein n=1 Tax=Portunus trituberculatus TaxID=210409 RepID=A0A5B7K6V1_PORTR|nr:hypothetical protein [Portunus trituberculatus]
MNKQYCRCTKLRRDVTPSPLACFVNLSSSEYVFKLNPTTTTTITTTTTATIPGGPSGHHSARHSSWCDVPEPGSVIHHPQYGNASHLHFDICSNCRVRSCDAI